MKFCVVGVKYPLVHMQIVFVSILHTIYVLNRCEGCLKSERRRLREAFRDFVWQHPEISNELKNELWKWIIRLDYPATVIVATV
jgi:hypothetical protein